MIIKTTLRELIEKGMHREATKELKVIINNKRKIALKWIMIKKKMLMYSIFKVKILSNQQKVRKKS